jgi:hypothetical protein
LGNACYHSIQSHLLSKNLKNKTYKTTILSVVLHGCGGLSITLRNEHRLRVSGNRVLRTIFGPKREEVAGGWRRQHNEELLREVVWEGADWMHLAEDRRQWWALVNKAMNLWVP